MTATAKKISELFPDITVDKFAELFDITSRTWRHWVAGTRNGGNIEPAVDLKTAVKLIRYALRHETTINGALERLADKFIVDRR